MGRIHRHLRKGNYAERVLAGTPVYLAANDEELNRLLAGVTFSQGGVLPNIKAVLLPKKTQKAKRILEDNISMKLS